MPQKYCKFSGKDSVLNQAKITKSLYIKKETVSAQKQLFWRENEERRLISNYAT